jgi:hypothetical protein
VALELRGDQKNLDGSIFLTGKIAWNKNTKK